MQNEILVCFVWLHTLLLNSNFSTVMAEVYSPRVMSMFVTQMNTQAKHVRVIWQSGSLPTIGIIKKNEQ